MSVLDHILKLGNPRLYEKCEAVLFEEISAFKKEINLMHEIILECNRIYGFGRGIAAPQVGLLKRIICLNLNGEKYTLFNPELTQFSEQKKEMWDDCMSFPNLLVRLERFEKCVLTYRDEKWQYHRKNLDWPLSELLQHEVDHLNGILATQRALDNKSFQLKT